MTSTVEPLGKYLKIETIKTLNIQISAYLAHHHLYETVFYVTPDDVLISRNIYIIFLVFQFCDTYLEVPLISMNTYHLELTPESCNLVYS